MSPQQREASDRARAFIDQIVSINREYGMGVSEDAYEGAVEGSAAVFAPLTSRSSSSSEPAVGVTDQK